MKFSNIVLFVLLASLFFFSITFWGVLVASQRHGIEYALFEVFAAGRGFTRNIDTLSFCAFFIVGSLYYFFIYTNTGSRRTHKAFKKARPTLTDSTCEVEILRRKSTLHVTTLIVCTTDGKQLEIIHPCFISKKAQNKNVLEIEAGSTGILCYYEFRGKNYFEEFAKDF